MTYPAAKTWKANSGESEDNPGSNGSESMPGVDELFKSRASIMFDNITRSSKRNLPIERDQRDGDAVFQPNVKI